MMNRPNEMYQLYGLLDRSINLLRSLFQRHTISSSPPGRTAEGRQCSPIDKRRLRFRKHSRTLFQIAILTIGSFLTRPRASLIRFQHAHTVAKSLDCNTSIDFPAALNTGTPYSNARTVGYSSLAVLRSASLDAGDTCSTSMVKCFRILHSISHLRA